MINATIKNLLVNYQTNVQKQYTHISIILLVIVFKSIRIKLKIISYFPKLCLWRVEKAIIAATAWTINDENNAHKNMWYHISGKHLKNRFC